MRSAIVPVQAGILCPHKITVADLIPGDCINGYDPYRRRVTSACITSIEPMPVSKKILATMLRFQTQLLIPETIIYTPHGERSLADARHELYGYCYENPKNLIIRQVDSLIETGEQVDTIKLTWESPDYIWLNGILVGTVDKWI